MDSRSGTASMSRTDNPTPSRQPSRQSSREGIMSVSPRLQPDNSPAPTKMPNTPAPTKWVRPEGDGLLSLAASLNITMGVTVFVCVVFHCVGSLFRPQLHLLPQEHTDAAH